MDVQLLNRKIPIEKRGISLKIIILWILGIVAAFSSGLFLKIFFTGGSSVYLISSVLLVSVFLVIFLLQVFFVKEKSALAFIVFLESSAIVFPFIGKSPLVLSFIPVIFIFFYLGSLRGIYFIENDLKISFWNVSKGVLPKSILAMSLLGGGLVPLYLPPAGQNNFPVSPFLFGEMVSSGSFLVDKFFPGFTSTSTMEEIAIKTAEKKLSQIPEVEILSSLMKQQLVKEAAGEFYAQISSYTGIGVDSNLSVIDYLYKISKEKFLGLSDKGRNIVYAILGILIFLAIEAVSLPLRLAISIIAFIVLEILLATGFAQISLEERSKEIIVT